MIIIIWAECYRSTNKSSLSTRQINSAGSVQANLCKRDLLINFSVCESYWYNGCWAKGLCIYLIWCSQNNTSLPKTKLWKCNSTNSNNPFWFGFQVWGKCMNTEYLLYLLETWHKGTQQCSNVVISAFSNSNLFFWNFFANLTNKNKSYREKATKLANILHKVCYEWGVHIAYLSVKSMNNWGNVDVSFHLI